MKKKVIVILICTLLLATTYPVVTSMNNIDTYQIPSSTTRGISPPIWEFVDKLKGSISTAHPYFGFSISIDVDCALIGAYNDDDNGPGSGSVYVFNRDISGHWTMVQKLTASDGVTFDEFGRSVSLDGNTALIGAPGDDGAKGSAYVFKYIMGSWIENTKITAFDGAPSDRFGWSVSLSGGYALIGAWGDDSSKGSAYVYSTSGIFQDKLTASDGAPHDCFGASVSLSGYYALIGSIGKEAAYVFKRDSSGAWNEEAKLTALTGPTQNFGYSVSIDGDTALIGGDYFVPYPGKAYVFKRDAPGVWNEEANLSASDGAPGDSFGVSVSLSGDTALIGSYCDDDKGADSGSAYLYVRTYGSGWIEQEKIIAYDGYNNDQFGRCVSLDGDTAFIGAPYDDDTGPESGSVYTFIREDPWPMFRHDAIHTGLSQYKGPDKLNLKWKVKTNDTVKSSPSVGNENGAGYYMIYVGSNDKWVYAIEDRGASGYHNKWVTGTGSIPQYGSFRSSPALTDFEYDELLCMYIGSDDGYLWNMEHISGTETFLDYNGNNIYEFPSSPSSHPFESSPSITDDYQGQGGIYVGCNDKYIYALNPFPLASAMWQYLTDGPVRSSPAVQYDVNLAVGSDDGYVYVLYPGSTPPVVQWIDPTGHPGFPTGGPVRSSPTISYWVELAWWNVAYVGSDDGYVYCIAWDSFSPTGYKELWRYMTNGPVRSSPAVANLRDYINADGIKDSVVVIGSNDGHIYALAGECPFPWGGLLWQYPASGSIGPVESSPAIDADGRIYVGSNDSNIYMLDGETGKLLSNFTTGGPVTSSPAIGPDNTIYVGSDDGYIYALWDKTGPSPPFIKGPPSGKVGEEYCWTICSTHPDGDDVMYIVDWDDGETTETDCYPSGEEVEVCHTYSGQGTYVIRAKAKECPDGLESDWAELSVTMPKNKIVNNPFLQFLEQYPILYQLLLRFLRL